MLKGRSRKKGEFTHLRSPFFNYLHVLPRFSFHLIITNGDLVHTTIFTLYMHPYPTTEDTPRFYVDGVAYDLLAFADKHPGGRHAIEICSERDATTYVISAHVNPLDVWSKLQPYRLDWQQQPQQPSDAFRKSAECVFRADVIAAVKEVREKHAPGLKWMQLTDTQVAFAWLRTIISLSVTIWWSYTGSIESCIATCIAFATCTALVIHDTVHAAVSRSAVLNTLCALVLVPFHHPLVWRADHIEHHSNTNSSKDPDVNAVSPMSRFTRWQPMHWMHKFQCVYVIASMPFLSFALFVKNVCITVGVNSPTLSTVRNVTWSDVMMHALYFGWWAVVPWHLCKELGVYIATVRLLSVFIVSMFHFMLISQLSHIQDRLAGGENETTQFRLQASTALNYGHDSTLVRLFCFNLQHQIEHHLLPTMHPDWFPLVAGPIQEVCRKHNVNYHYERNFTGALYSYLRTMYQYGQEEEEHAE
jgi:fatty acid desaturase